MTQEAESSFYRYLLGGVFVVALIWTTWASLVPVTFLPATNFSDKVAHAINYAVLAVLLSMAWRRLPLWLVVLCVVSFGGLIEIAQWKTGYRHGEWLDMLANLAGAVGGCLIRWLHIRWNRHSGR